MRFLLCVLMMVSAGCSPSVKVDYNPLAVGQETTLAARTFYPDGRFSDALSYNKIEGIVERNGKTYFRCHVWSEGRPKDFDTIGFMRKDEKALYTIIESITGPSEQVEAILPLKVGATSHRMVGETWIADTMVRIESIQVEGTAYENCKHIQSAGIDGIIMEERWQAPNVGTVRATVTLEEGLTLTTTLKEFKPGK